MRRHHLAVAMLCAAALGGCVGPDRGLNGTVDDITIGTHVSLALIDDGNPSVTVYQGRVLLTGSTPSPQAKAQAEADARRVNGVRMVYNEMVVAPTRDINETASDSWISAEVRSQMLLAADVRSANYQVAVDHGTVYLIGGANSQAELDRATQIARYVPGVRRVISYVEIRGMPAAGPGPGPGPGPAPAPYQAGPEPPVAAPAPNAPIQVQKL